MADGQRSMVNDGGEATLECPEHVEGALPYVAPASCRLTKTLAARTAHSARDGRARFHRAAEDLV